MRPAPRSTYAGAVTSQTRPLAPVTLTGHAMRTLAVLLISAVLFAFQVSELSTLDANQEMVFTDRAAMIILADMVLGAISYPLMFLRRRWPLTIGVITAVMGAFSSIAAGPAILCTVSVISRRRWRDVAILAVPNILGAIVFERMTSQQDALDMALLVGFAIVGYAAMVGFGLYIGARRDLVTSLQQRVAVAEREQQARSEQARAAERTRIAREMHDVLAHRISVVAMHSGVLSSRSDLTPDQVRSTAAVIEGNSRAALEDLRAVLGVLRQSGEGPGEKEAPQPTLTGLSALLEQTRQAGAEVELVAPSDESLEQIPEPVSRAAYRVIQEGLTNARKHAPGAPIRVEVEPSPQDRLVIRVINGPSRGGQPLGGAGLGLVGVRERAALLGGSVDARSRPDGGFGLEVSLPWRP